MRSKTRILVAPLNWGLGHATRSIPIINALITHGFEPMIASDGPALDLLKKEFPKIICLELPSYNMKYPSNGRWFKLNLAIQMPKIIRAIRAERKMVRSLIDKYEIKGIISDNRFGVYNGKVPSVYMTHQLNVLSGSTSWMSTALHSIMIKNFDECWVPDMENEPNLSGRLGHIHQEPVPLKYLGVISRFEKLELPISSDLLVLLSGPEPQRTLLEDILLRELKGFDGTIIFVRGQVEKSQSITRTGNITIYNFMLANELEKAINRSFLVLSRPGYSTLMDLAKLEKKAFFIPTPGQYEQEYLASRLKNLEVSGTCNQDEFNMEVLGSVKKYHGLRVDQGPPDYKKLFRLFEGK